MSERFKLTQEEINKAIMHSPYALPDSPGTVGLGAGQIKKYFYDFIRFLSDKINIHLGQAGDSIEALEKAKDDIQGELLSLWDKANGAYSMIEEIDLSPLGTKEDIERAKTEALNYTDYKVGAIDSALDAILQIQSSLIGGEGE